MEAAKNINQTKKDILGCLPPEIVQDISLYLTPESLEKASICNKLWNMLLNPSYFWYKKCQVRGYNELKDISISAIYEKYLVRFPLYWQLLFNYNQLQYNWRNDIYTTTSVAGPSFVELNYFDDEVLIATTISQYNIYIIDSCTGQIKKIISLPKRIIRFVKYQNLLVVVMTDNSLEDDKYLQVLTIEGIVLFTMKLDGMSITESYFMVRVKVYKTLIAINNLEDPLHIIDFEKKTIAFKKANVCCVCFGDEVIALGKTNGTIKILDMNYITLRRFTHRLGRRINKIMISQDYMITFAETPHSQLNDHDACVWKLKENVILYTIKKISIFDERYTSSIYQDKLIFIKDVHLFSDGRNVLYRTRCKLVVMDLSTGNQIFDTITFSRGIRTSLSNGHYMFATTTTKERTGGTAYIHCSQSGKEIASIINDIYDDAFLVHVGYMCYPLRSTETKLAYITNKGDLFVRNYEMSIH